MDVFSIELRSDDIDILYEDNSREEIDDGVYLVEDDTGTTIEERPAEQEDTDRLSELASDFEEALPEITSEIRDVHEDDAFIEIEYADGSSEQINNGIYERENSSGQTIVERPATEEDKSRLETLAEDYMARLAEAEEAEAEGDGVSDTDGEAMEEGDGETDAQATGEGEEPGPDAEQPEGEEQTASVEGDTPTGDDPFQGTRGKDDLSGGDDDDRMSGMGGDDRLDGGAGNDFVRGGRGDDTIDGGDGKDKLVGQGGDDHMSGGGDADRMKGGGGDDTLLGDEGNDFLKGGKGHDEVQGGGGDDRLAGNFGDDTINGGAGDDVLLGGSGFDRLDGGEGADRYKGGGGADVFVFSDDGAEDTILDYQDGMDKIDLSSYGFSDASSVIDAAYEDGGDTYIDLGGGDVIRLEDTSLSDLSTDDFIL